jgi:hypothetical protein
VAGVKNKGLAKHLQATSPYSKKTKGAYAQSI